MKFLNFELTAQTWSSTDQTLAVAYSVISGCGEPPKVKHFWSVGWFERNETTGLRSHGFTLNRI